MLGSGFYNVHEKDEWFFEQAPWRDEPTLLFQLRLDYADGTSETIVSDSSWKASAGPVVHDGIRNGEEYDARLEQPGWDTAAFDDSAWAAPQIGEGPKGALHAQTSSPIRVMQTITPIGVTEPKPGVFVFDLGQNIAGWAQLKVSGPAGTKVTMRYSERLHADGTLSPEPNDKFVYEGPFQTDRYTLKGQGEEVWEPRFTYHGYPLRRSDRLSRQADDRQSSRPRGSYFVHAGRLVRVLERTLEQDSTDYALVVSRQFRGHSDRLPAPRKERLDRRRHRGRRAGDVQLPQYRRATKPGWTIARTNCWRAEN